MGFAAVDAGLLQICRLDAISPTPQAVAQDLIDHFGVPAQKLSVIYNPLDLVWIERLSREKLENSWLCASASPLILAVGSLAVLKDFPTLIRAFAAVRSPGAPAGWRYSGDGPDRRDLEKLAAEIGFTGRRISSPAFVDNPFALDAWRRRRGVQAPSLTEGCPNTP